MFLLFSIKILKYNIGRTKYIQVNHVIALWFLISISWLSPFHYNSSDFIVAAITYNPNKQLYYDIIFTSFRKSPAGSQVTGVTIYSDMGN